MADNNPHSVDFSNLKAVSYEALKRYHHEVNSALGLENDTMKYNYTTDLKDPEHAGETYTAPENVKDAMDTLYDKTLIMCDDAKAYFEKQYHDLFNVTYSVKVTVTGGKTIDPKTTESGSTELKAVFSGTALLKSPSNPDGESKPLTITDIDGVDSSWTKSETEANTYTKTVTYGLDGTDKDFDYTVNSKSFDIKGNVTYKEWDAVKTAEKETTKTQNNVTNSTSFTITKTDVWFNDLASMDAATFNANYKTAKTFTATKGSTQAFQTVDHMPLIFACTSKHAFTQSGLTIIPGEATAITTKYGTYYVHVSDSGNGTSWNVEIDK